MSGSGTENTHGSTPDVLVLVVKGGSDGVILEKGESGGLHACVCSKASHPAMSHMGIAPLETDTPSNTAGYITAERTTSGETPQVRRMPRYTSSFEVGLN